MAKNICKSFIWTADKDMNESDPRSNVHYLSSSENKAWKKKNSGLYRIWTHDLCNTSIAEVMASNPVQAFSFTTAQVVHITARITLVHTTNYI